MTLAEYLSAETMTEEAFAAKAGLSQSQINRIRRGLSRPSWETVAVIDRVTGGKVTASDWMAPATPTPESDAAPAPERAA